VSLIWAEKAERASPSWVDLVALGVLFGLGFVGLTNAVERPVWEVLTGSYGLSESELQSSDRMDY